MAGLGVSPPRMLAASSDAPPQIDSASHGFQVGRIDASPIPTEMVNIEAIGDRSYEELIGVAVGWDPSVRGGAEVPVALHSDGADPVPAAISLIHALPESVLGRPPNPAATDVAIPLHARVVHDAHLVPARWLRAPLNLANFHSRYMVAEQRGKS